MLLDFMLRSFEYKFKEFPNLLNLIQRATKFAIKLKLPYSLSKPSIMDVIHLIKLALEHKFMDLL